MDTGATAEPYVVLFIVSQQLQHQPTPVMADATLTLLLRDVPRLYAVHELIGVNRGTTHKLGEFLMGGTSNPPPS